LRGEVPASNFHNAEGSKRFRYLSAEA
jgi:hypothetical protein